MIFSYFTFEQILPFIISAIIYVISILAFNINREKTSLILLYIGSLGIGIFIANLDPFLILWDEQFHALVAKNILLNPIKPTLFINPLLEYDYKNWSANHVWLHKQPLFLWQIAISLKIFGLNEFAVRIPSILLHTGLVFFIYRIGRIASHSSIGYYGALFFSLAYYPLELVAGRYSTDHNDVAFLFYITATFWAWFEYQNSKKKYWLFIIGVLSGFAVLVKWLVGLIIFVVWFITCIFNNNRGKYKLHLFKPLIISLILSIVVFLPWQVFILFAYEKEALHEFQYNTRHFFHVIENHGGDFLFHFDAIKIMYGSGVAIPFIILVGLGLLMKAMVSKMFRLAIFSFILIVYIFYTVAATKLVSYTIIASPFIYLGIGALVSKIIEYINIRINIKMIKMIICSVSLFIVCYFLINIKKIANYHTNWKPNDNCSREMELTVMKFIDKITKVLPDNKYVIFTGDLRPFGNIPVMFYTKYISYDFIPTEFQINEIRKKDYNIAIYDSGNLPYYIVSDHSIVKIKL